MKVILVLLFSCSLFSCNSQDESIKPENINSGILERMEANKPDRLLNKTKPDVTYNKAVSRIISQRNKYKLLYNTLSNQKSKDSLIIEIGNYLDHYLVDSIFPYWYGTPWDFNGYTNTPNIGVIACGYFVSTTLKHAGLNINRYKQAQQTGYSEALTLSVSNPIVDISIDQSELKEYFKNNLKNGLYFVGLDNHVGYLLFRNNELYFIHSDYATYNAVNIELAENSYGLNSSRYVITPIGNNKELMKRWILNSKVDIILDK